MDEAAYYKCGGCGYEFLSKAKEPICPKCQSNKMESKDIRGLAEFDE